MTIEKELRLPIAAWLFHGGPDDGQHARQPKVRLDEPGGSWPVREPLCLLSDAETQITALLAQLEEQRAVSARMEAALHHAKTEMRSLIENSLCAADPDRPFSDVRHEVKQHPSLKAIDDVLAGGRNA